MSEIPLRLVLQRVGGELARLCELGKDTQDAAGLLMGAASDGALVPEAALVGLQALDALTQHLSALSAFLGEVAAGVSDAVTVEPKAAAFNLSLEALRADLLGEVTSGCMIAELELF